MIRENLYQRYIYNRALISGVEEEIKIKYKKKKHFIWGNKLTRQFSREHK